MYVIVSIVVSAVTTVEPLLKDTIKTTSLQRTLSKAPKIDFLIVVIHFSPLKSGQPLYSGQISWSQCVLYKEVPLYTEQHCSLHNTSGGIQYFSTQVQLTANAGILWTHIHTYYVHRTSGVHMCTYVCTIHLNTVVPLLKDSPNKGH